jgi:hypothetical protein
MGLAVAGHKGINKLMSNPTAEQAVGLKPLGFLTKQTTENAFKNVLERSAPRLAGTAFSKVAPGLVNATGGPLATPINAAFELYDMGTNGVNLDTDFRKSVTPDGTFFGEQAPPGLSYAGSAFNAWSNPIRSSMLLGKDIGQLTGIDYPAPTGPSLPGNYMRANDLNVKTQDVINKQKAQLERLAEQGKLTPGQQSDLVNWKNRQNNLPTWLNTAGEQLGTIGSELFMGM